MTIPTLVELTCQELVELATEYLSHAMAEDDRARFEQHLLVCPPCTAYLAQLRATVDLAGGLREADLPAEMAQGLAALFERWKGT